MSKLGIAKLVINYTVGASAGFCVSSVIANSIEPENTEEKIKVVVGSMVIGSMVAQQSRQYVNNIVDDAVEFVQNQKAKKEAAAQ